LKKIHRTVFVDLPIDGTSYPPTAAFTDPLAQIGMPGLLRAALLANLEWANTRLWDDSAALYLLAPRLFKPNGAHLEPAVDEDTLRNAIIKAINGDNAPTEPNEANEPTDPTEPPPA